MELEAAAAVPKPLQKISLIDDGDKGVDASGEVPPKGVVSGNPGEGGSVQPDVAEPESAFRLAKEIVRRCVREIRQNHGDALNRSELIRIEQVFRKELIPRRKPGRRPMARITRAYEAYQSGKRGLILYREHIPGWAGMSIWRRSGEQRKLMAAILSRRRRHRLSHQNVKAELNEQRGPVA
jgi:hypothetical protein